MAKTFLEVEVKKVVMIVESPQLIFTWYVNAPPKKMQLKRLFLKTEKGQIFLSFNLIHNNYENLFVFEQLYSNSCVFDFE